MTKSSLLSGLLLAAAPFAARAQGVGIGTATPAASAALEVASTSQGLLLPRLSSAQRAAIASPAQGLEVYQTDGTPGLYYYSGVVWLNLANGRVPDAAGSAVPPNGGVVSTLASVPNVPAGVALDASGTVYVAEQGTLVQKITPAGVVSTLAGNSAGTTGSANGTGANATFNSLVGIAVAASGTVYVADQNNNLIRQITPAGVVSTLAGSGAAGTADGTGTAASFNKPTGLALDAAGTLYVTEQSGHVIRKITPAGEVSTLAGSGAVGSANATGTAASFNQPTGVAVDATGTVYVADRSNNRIRKITPAGVVTTLAGSGTAGSLDGPGTDATFNGPFGVGVDGGGTVYVADRSGNRIRKITPAGVVSTLAGSAGGSANGTGTNATFSTPFGVVVTPAGVIYVADFGNRLIRVIK